MRKIHIKKPCVFVVKKQNKKTRWQAGLFVESGFLEGYS